MQQEVVTIEHIGSTAVAAIRFAKPIIDLRIIVQSIDRIDEIRALHYEVRGENGQRGRWYFTKGSDVRTHHVHIYEEGHPAIVTHLTVKRYLLARPDEAEKYGACKIALAKQYADDHYAYEQQKEVFVWELIARAKKWNCAEER